MISGRVIMVILLLGLVMCLAVRMPGVWLYDVIARRLRRGQPGGATARADQVRQPG